MISGDHCIILCYVKTLKSAARKTAQSKQRSRIVITLLTLFHVSRYRWNTVVVFFFFLTLSVFVLECFLKLPFHQTDYPRFGYTLTIVHIILLYKLQHEFRSGHSIFLAVRWDVPRNVWRGRCHLHAFRTYLCSLDDYDLIFIRHTCNYELKIIIGTVLNRLSSCYYILIRYSNAQKYVGRNIIIYSEIMRGWKKSILHKSVMTGDRILHFFPFDTV